MRVVGYCRLSRDDGNDESISITNQKKIIREYAREHDLTISEFYEDDGYSGYSFDRPAFNRLKKDLKDGIVDVVIAKDLSRIGRHNAKTLLFIEEVTNLNKQIIIINDGFDNMSNDDDMLGILSWFNERYVKDTSKKVRSAISVLQNNGEWISNIPYGYKRIYGKKKTFEVDPVTSVYVKRIFNDYVGGKGGHTIAKELSNDGIPTPTMAQNIHREEAGIEPLKNVAKTWSSTIVRRIITNEFYVGTLVQRKVKTVGIKGKKVFMDKDDAMRFPNHHEAIIDQQTFNLAQQLIKDRDRNNYRGVKKYKNILSGIMFCGDCGKTMTVQSGSQKDTIYTCRTYHTLGKNFCNFNKVYEKDILRIIKVYLTQCRESLAENISKLDDTIKNELKQVYGNDKVDALNTLEGRLENANNELKTLITQKTKEIVKNPDVSEIIEETYQEMINGKMQYIKILKEQIETQKDVKESTKNIQSNLKNALKIFDEIIASDEMTKKQVSILIERIDVYYEKGIVIKMRGDLNSIIEPKIEVTLNREQAYTKAIVDKMCEDGEFYLMAVHQYLRDNGYNYGYYRTFKPIADRLEDLGIIKRGANNNIKTKIIVDKQTAYTSLDFSTVAEVYPGVCTNSASMESLIKISKWIEELLGNGGGLTDIL